MIKKVCKKRSLREYGFMLLNHEKKPRQKNIFLLYKYGKKRKLVLMSSLPYENLEDSVNVYAANVKVSADGAALASIDGISAKKGDIISDVMLCGECRVYKKSLKIDDDSTEYEKFESSISRSRGKITEYVDCNEFRFFVTLTFRKEKQFKTHEEIKKFLSAFRKSCNRRGIKYLIVPEFCKNGQIHFHGFFSEIPFGDLYVNEWGHLDWRYWRENFGFCNIRPIKDEKDRKKILAYVIKYIVKSLSMTVVQKGLHVYYCSKGLQKKILIYKGYGYYFGKWDYACEDGYCYVSILEKSQFLDFVTIDGEIFP